MSGPVKTRTKRSYSASDVREAIALDAERRPPSFSRQGHGHQPCACPCQGSATVRPRPRAGGEPSSCEVLSIRRQRWCAGRFAARRRPERLESFGTILAVLAVPLQVVWSATQVLLVPLACASRPQRSLTSGCTPWVAGGCLAQPGKLLSMAVRRERAAASWRQAGARAVRHGGASWAHRWLGGPRPRLGRQQVVEPADRSCLAGPPGPTAEPGGLWSPWVRSRVRV